MSTTKDAESSSREDGRADLYKSGQAGRAEKASVTTSASSPASSSVSSQARPVYTQQFSENTEMILKRIKGGAGNISSVISSASLPASIKQSSDYEDVKRRLVMNMSTISSTLPLPYHIPARSSAQNRALRWQPALSAQSAPATPIPGQPAPSSSQPAQQPGQAQMPQQAQKAQPGGLRYGGSRPSAPGNGPDKLAMTAMTKKGKQNRGLKRKRAEKEDDEEDDDSSELTDPSSAEEQEIGEDEAARPILTKSGRQIMKPIIYKPPSEMPSAKRKYYGKRTSEQMLCKVCQRGISPETNQIVFCDGCNCCWHQLCHDPHIDHGFVSNETWSWFCRTCQAKREKVVAKKRPVASAKKVSWSTLARLVDEENSGQYLMAKKGLSDEEQRLSYLSTLSHGQLVDLVMHSLKVQPDLPIFTPHEDSTPARFTPLATSAVSSVGASVTQPGPSNGASEKEKMNGQHETATGKWQAEREASSDSVPPAWPKVGQGCLAGTELNLSDFEDDNDYEAFSVIKYNTKGEKVEENGVAITPPKGNA